MSESSNDATQPSQPTQQQLDRQVRQAMARKTRRSFLLGGTAALGAFAAYEWMNHDQSTDPMQKPMRVTFRRAAENANATLFRDIFHEKVLAPTYSKNQATELRINGDIGIDQEMLAQNWRLQVVGLDHPEKYPQFTADLDLWDYSSTNAPTPSTPKPSNSDTETEDVKGPALAQHGTPSNNTLAKTPGLLLTMADIQKLPRAEMVTQFKCIEGWSQIVYWEGARFRDFLQAYPPRLNPDGSLPKYVAMETSEGDFFTGYDMESMLHPQTLLCYAMGGKPLSPGHGAPLRLAMPIKYGYKQIKQIAKITYTNQKPEDYWGNLGYDWYGGL